MTDLSRRDYLDRLDDLLPAKEGARVRQDVSALIDDRIEAALHRDPALSDEQAERRALEALGPPERLADDLVSAPLTIPLATRRSFVRLLAAVFACHLLLSIALTVAGAQSAPITGLLTPLPKEPFSAVFLGVITIFLIDTGALLALFVAVGRARPDRFEPAMPLDRIPTRRGAIEGLILLGLVAVILNFLLDAVFAVKQGDDMQPFLAGDLKEVLPLANIVLVFFAARHVLTILGRGAGSWAAAAGALGSLAGSAFFVLAATRGKLVSMPAGSKLGRASAEVLDSLIERVFLLVFVVAALMLIVSFVGQAIRFSRKIRS